MMQMNTEKFVICYYAIMKIGAVAVPLNVRLTSNEVAYILEDSDSIAIFYDEVFEPVIEKATKNNQLLRWKIYTGNTQLTQHDKLVDACSDKVEYPAIEIKESDDYQILYTSGTTGNPKGALFEHHRILQLGSTISITMQINPDD